MGFETGLCGSSVLLALRLWKLITGLREEPSGFKCDPGNVADSEELSFLPDPRAQDERDKHTANLSIGLSYTHPRSVCLQGNTEHLVLTIISENLNPSQQYTIEDGLPESFREAVQTS